MRAKRARNFTDHAHFARPHPLSVDYVPPHSLLNIETKITEFMLVPHLHLCNRAGFRDNAVKSGKLGHNRDIGLNSGTVPGKPGHLATMHGDGE